MKIFLLTLGSYLLFPLTFIYRFFFAMDKIRKTPKHISHSIVLSVGNLSVGGTGKTPFTMHLISVLEKTQLPLCVLSRGYGGKSSKQGMKVLEDTDPKECGDEPALIKQNYPHVEVLIGRDRYNSYLTHYPNPLENKIILLDDGFQHHSLHRDLDFVLIDSGKLLGNGWTLPAGFLREPLSALERAHFVVFTKYELSHKERVDKFQSQIAKEFPHLKFIKMEFIPSVLKNRDGEVLNLNEISQKACIAFSGIGNFASFQNTISSLCPLSVEFHPFPDHFPFVEKHIEELFLRSKEKILICTAKDFVKFQAWIHKKIEYNNLWYLEMKTNLDIPDEELLKEIPKIN